MAESKELKKIKKIYGESFMHLCRNLFPTVLEKEGLLLDILTSNFSSNCRSLAEDIKQGDLEEQFKSFIYSKIDVEKEIMEKIEHRAPYEIMDEAGYYLYECQTEEDIQKFEKYYKDGERLCTFNGGRLDRCIVFFAVRKDVDEIKREDFDSPKREDRYGTSVMSIQFTKSNMCVVSIKNRYNHTVNNPDATYGNDLERIARGLTSSFADLLVTRGFVLNNSNTVRFDIPMYTVAANGKYYRYNKEINGVYYCPGNIIIDDGRIIKLEDEKKLLVDYFVIDKENKKIELYDSNIKDAFVDGLDDIKEIKVTKDKDERVIEIIKNGKSVPIEIRINKNNAMVEYRNEEVEEIGDFFLYYQNDLKELFLPKLEGVGRGFLRCNKTLEKFEAPNLKIVGYDTLRSNLALRELSLPSAEKIDSYFLYENRFLTKLYIPKVKEIGNGFLYRNESLKKLSLPEVTHIKDFFMYWNKDLESIDMPKVKVIEDKFLYSNKKLKEINFPELVKVGDHFIYWNEDIESCNLESLNRVGETFLYENDSLRELDLPNLQSMGGGFLGNNKRCRDDVLTKFVERRERQVREEQITAKDISLLDKSEEITTQDIDDAEKALEHFEKDKDINNRN